MIDRTWRKPSRSGDAGNCVEVRASNPGTVAVRDSKDREGTALAFTEQAWSVFIQGVKRHEFDL
jgi:predicted secreted Zn-dependent protease